MAAPKEDNRSLEFINVLKNEHMKTHVKRDAEARVEILYEAPAHVQDGEPCLATIYDYGGTSSNVPTNTLERLSVWSAAWDVDTDTILVNGQPGYTE